MNGHQNRLDPAQRHLELTLPVYSTAGARTVTSRDVPYYGALIIGLMRPYSEHYYPSLIEVFVQFDNRILIILLNYRLSMSSNAISPGVDFGWKFQEMLKFPFKFDSLEQSG